MTNDLPVVAAQLVEAAYSRGPSVKRGLFKGPDSAADGGTGAGYDLLITCLRTGLVHGLRMVFVDEGRHAQAVARAEAIGLL